MTQVKNVGIWIRVSTEDQVRGESPEHHEKRARLYAEAKAWQVSEVYRLEAVSGKSVMEHPETQRMLADIRSCKISGIIFSKLARLARNTRELLDFADIFRECDADLVSLQESIDTSTPAGRLFYTMIAAMAQWEREEIAERVAASVPIRAKLGKPLGGQAPFGYRWDDKKLVIEPKEAPVRKLMYELFLEHKRKRTVARLLNEAGYRTRGGFKFDYSTVYRLLRDPMAKGLRRANYSQRKGKNYEKYVIKPESEWVFTEAPAIVSADLWDACNHIIEEQLKKNKRPAKRTKQLFAGIAFCVCGGKMYVPSNSPKYVCQKCRNKIGLADLETIFQEQLKTFLFSDTDIQNYFAMADAQIKEKDCLFATLSQERKRVIDEMDSIMKLYQKKELPPEGFGRHYRPLEERLRQIDNQLPELQAEIDFLKINFLSSGEILHEAQDLHSHWPSMTPDDKRKIVELITEKIIIDKADIQITLSYLPTPPKLVADGHRTPTGSKMSPRLRTISRSLPP